MSTPLTHEQFKRLDALFRLLDGTSSPDECYAILETAFREGKLTADAALAQLQAQLATAHGDDKVTGSYAWCKAECRRMRGVIDECCAHADTLRAQLAAAQARCAQLEEALREAADNLRTMRTRTMQIETADAIVRLLTPTERPPA